MRVGFAGNKGFLLGLIAEAALERAFRFFEGVFLVVVLRQFYGCGGDFERFAGIVAAEETQGADGFESGARVGVGRSFFKEFERIGKLIAPVAENADRGRTGVARMALESGAPVVPVGIIGTDKVQPVGSRFPKIVPVTVRFGEPLDFSRYDGMQESLPVLRSVTDEIIYRILDLSGQEYVDAYQKTPVAA